MAVTVAQLVTRVQGLCRPVTSVTEAEIKAILIGSSAEVSQHSPQRKAVSGTLTDGAVDLSTLTGWVDGVSVVTAVESPVDEVPRAILHPALWDQAADYTLGVSGATTQTVRVYFNTDHIVDATTTTYSTKEGEAAAQICAAQVLESLASRWGQAQSVSVAGDQYSGPYPDGLNTIAKGFRDRANQLLGVNAVAVCVGFEPLGYDFTPDPF